MYAYNNGTAVPDSRNGVIFAKSARQVTTYPFCVLAPSPKLVGLPRMKRQFPMHRTESPFNLWDRSIPSLIVGLPKKGKDRTKPRKQATVEEARCVWQNIICIGFVSLARQILRRLYSAGLQIKIGVFPPGPFEQVEADNFFPSRTHTLSVLFSL